MTTPGSGRQLTYACNGVTTTFNCPVFLQPADLKVYLLDEDTDGNGDGSLLASGVHYSMTGVPRAGTAQIHTNVAYANGKYIRLFRVTNRAQGNDYVPNDGFPADSHEIALDRMSLIDEEHDGDIGAAIRVPAGDTIPALPSTAARPDRFMQFDYLGKEVLLRSPAQLADTLAPLMRLLLAELAKGDPGSPGEGYSTRANMAAAGPAASNLDDAYLTEPGRSGKWIFYTAAGYLAATGKLLTTMVANDPGQGAFVASSANATGAAGAWVRDVQGPYNVRWWGAKGDDATNDAPAFVAALAFLQSIAIGTGYTNTKGSPPLYVPQGIYYMGATTLDIRHALRFYGDGFSDQAACTILRWNAGATGIRLQSGNTDGATGVVPAGSLGPGASGTIIEGFLIKGAYNGVEGEFHGVDVRCHFTMRDCVVQSWQGNGANVVGGFDGNPRLGNCNLFRIERVAFEANRDGLYITGTDANAGSTFDCSFADNRATGLNDRSFLGNFHYNHHATGNGIVPTENGVNVDPTICSYMGLRYSPVPDRVATAKLNPPSGTTADNDDWVYAYPGGVSPQSPAWVSGLPMREGGSYILWGPGNGNSCLSNCYHELAQGVPQVAFPAYTIGGLMSSDVKGNGAWLHMTQGFLQIRKFSLLAQMEIGGFIKFTGNSTFPGVPCIYNDPGLGLVLCGNGSAGDIYIGNNTGGRVISIATGTGEVQFEGNVLLNGGKALRINGVDVVKGQQGAIGDDASGAANQGKVNSILAALRGCGIIAP